MKTKVCGKDADAINQVAVTFKIRNGKAHSTLSVAFSVLIISKINLKLS